MHEAYPAGAGPRGRLSERHTSALRLGAAVAGGDRAYAGEEPVLASLGGNRPYRLSLVVGPPEYVLEHSADIVQPPRAALLDQNVPNPFNPVTRIRFGLPRPAEVTLEIFDVRGRRVTSLLQGEPRQAGYHTAVWTGLDDNGSRVSSGVYLYRLTMPGEPPLVRKLLVAK